MSKFLVFLIFASALVFNSVFAESCGTDADCKTGLVCRGTVSSGKEKVCMSEADANKALEDILDVSGLQERGEMSQLLGAKTFKCSFSIYSNLNFFNENNLPLQKPKIKVEKISEPFELLFDNVDHEKRTARLIGNAGSADVQIVDSDDSFTLIEIAPAGTVQLTVLFDSKNDAGEYLAVHSRHTSIFNMPTPSQYAGSCKVHE